MAPGSQLFQNAKYRGDISIRFSQIDAVRPSSNSYRSISSAGTSSRCLIDGPPLTAPPPFLPRGPHESSGRGTGVSRKSSDAQRRDGSRLCRLPALASEDQHSRSGTGDVSGAAHASVGTAMAADCHRITLRHDPALSHQATRNRSPALPNATPAPGGEGAHEWPAVRCSPVRDSASARRSSRNYPGEAQGEIAE